MKTASELAVEYWDKPPVERINSTLQDYVYNYQKDEITQLKNRVAQLETLLYGELK